MIFEISIILMGPQVSGLTWVDLAEILVLVGLALM